LILYNFAAFGTGPVPPTAKPLVNVNGTVNRGQVSTDLSAIPVSAVERIEILRDGASSCPIWF